ncbi:MAG: DUF4870 domain-containing protein [Verrucomicrobiota bacterium]
MEHQEPQTPPTSSDAPPMDAATEKNYVMASHLLGLTSLVGIPSFVGPLVIWLWKKGVSERIDYNAKESLNFQLCVFIVQIISVPLTLVFGLGALTMVAAYVIGIIFSIIGAIKASEGHDYRYPWSYRLVN